MTMSFPYRRILLKLSGEIFLGKQSFGINEQACQHVASAISSLHQLGLEIAVVLGGGNIFRGIHLEKMGLERTAADHMGMLATMMNGIALQQALQNHSCDAKVMSALECPKVVESYHWRDAMPLMSAGHILIFVGGTGNPYFTTDTAAALRASEIHADILMKATKVDGVFNKDPQQYPDAVKYETLSYSKAFTEKLEVMDATAIALCRKNDIPIFVFNMERLWDEAILTVLSHPEIGTMVKGE
ncbi:MAG: UMP kinase [Waddliaceae bacterium]